MKKIIVTGGTGFLGRNMIKYLCGRGCTVYAIVRPDSKNLPMLPDCANLTKVYSSFDRLSECASQFPDGCDAFYHFAWGGVNRSNIDNEDVQQANILNSMNALEFAHKIGCRIFIQAGSRSEYGLINGKYTEEADCFPAVAYGRAKLKFSRLAADFCRRNRMGFVNPRIFSVYGYDDHPWSLIYSTVSKMLKNEPADFSPCTQQWNFMDVRDACDLMFTFYEKFDRIPSDDNGIFNVATDDVRPLRDFINEIKEITKSASVLNFGTFKQTADSTYSVIPDMTKTEKTFGWHSKIRFCDGIRYMIQHMD